MKKLNRKGFTLIELLAVIVIMAIIVVVTVPTIINTIADARVSSIWNLAVATANSYDTMSAQDLIASDSELAGVSLSQTEWKCFDDVTNKDSEKLSTILDLSDTDLVLDGTAPTGDNPTVSADILAADGSVTTEGTCSAIRLKSNGSAEVLLVAKDGGKFDVAGKVVYALSSSDKGVQQ